MSILKAIRHNYWRLEIKQFFKWNIIYNPIWKFTYKGYYIWLWNIPDILHKFVYGQPGDNGLPNCIFHGKNKKNNENQIFSQTQGTEYVKYK